MAQMSPFYDTLYETMLKTWPMITLFVVILISVKISHMVINHEKMVFYKDLYMLLAIIYFLLLYYLLLSMENDISSGFNLIPFREMTRYEMGSRMFMYNVVGNIVLFIPFGYFISDFLKAKKISHILIVSIIASLTAELIQSQIGRAFDVDDIILNVVGAILGFMFYISIQAIKNHLPRVLQNNVFYNIIAILVLLAIIFLFGSIWGIRI